MFASLRDHIAALLAEVVAADDIPNDVKRTVVDYLEQMLDALLSADTRTTKLFWRIVESLAGRIGLDDKICEALRKSKAGERVLKVVAAFVFILHGGVTIDTPIKLPLPDQRVVYCVDQNLTPALPPGGRTAERPPGDPPPLVDSGDPFGVRHIPEDS